jgi:hypothetical protein
MIQLLSYGNQDGSFKRQKILKAQMESGDTVAIFDIDTVSKSGRDFVFTAQAFTSGFAPRALTSAQYVLTGEDEGKLFVHASYSAGDTVTVIGTLANLES